MPNGPILTPPPLNPDSSPPVLSRGEFTLSWNQDVKCRFNLVAVDKLATYLLSNQTFSAAILSAAGPQRERDGSGLKRLIKTAFWIHIDYLYTKRRRSSASPAVQAARLNKDAVAKRKVTVRLFRLLP